jgi:hypothetical protein
MISVDEITARILTAKAMATRRTPSEIVQELVRKELQATA